MDTKTIVTIELVVMTVQFIGTISSLVLFVGKIDARLKLLDQKLNYELQLINSKLSG